MYIFENIGFRPIDETDLEILRINRNDSSTLLNLGSVDLISCEHQKIWWSGISKSKSQQWFCIIKENYENVIGVLRFQNIDQINKSIEIGADIFPNYRDQGYGKKAYKMALEYLFQHFNMHCVYLHVAEFNKTAIELYKRAGFVETGRIPKSIFRYGKYWDKIIMCILFDNYLNKL